MTHRNFTSPCFFDTPEVSREYQPHDWFMARSAPLTSVIHPSSGIDFTFDTAAIGRGVPPAIQNAAVTQLSLLSTMIRNKVLRHKKDKKFMKMKMSLIAFDISQLNFVVNSKKLYRVFNRSSFELGGRFYGALHQTMPKEFRKDILINGEPTAELDYTAHHIRIPYHLEGIDYREDPYLALTDDVEGRNMMKKLLLAAMNAESEREAIKGFRGSLKGRVKKGDGTLTDENIKKMLKRVRETHPHISNYIHSGFGIKLQFIDSQITEAILLHMTRQGIPCLPVHDSYIVPQQFKVQLKEAMDKEYERIIGFLPVIG